MDKDSDFNFKINKSYAEKYNQWRRKEEIQKLKDRYGGKADEEELASSSTSESEDEDAKEWTSSMEKEWLATLAALKSKDPQIYDKNVRYVRSEEEKQANSELPENKSTKKPKPMYPKDYERKVLLDREGKFSDDDDDDNNNQVDDIPMGSNKLSYFEDQDLIKNEFHKALEDSDASDDEIFKAKTKTSNQKKEEDEDYIEWLKGQKPEDAVKEAATVTKLKTLKQYWSDPQLNDSEKYLRDYVLNKRYLEKSNDDIPSYDEIVGDENFSEEEQQLEKEDAFEAKYNFRFEEPDSHIIKTYPRNIADSVRQKDEKRSKKRKEINERKEMAKEKKKEELKQLKNLKRKEIEEKIAKLKEITGNEMVGFSEQDFDEDFDPAKYDKLMQKVFDEDYYDAGNVEDTKPVFESEDEEYDIENPWNVAENVHDDTEEIKGKRNRKKMRERDDEGNGFNQDLDFDMDADATAEPPKRSKNKMSNFAKAIAKRKPVFNPDEKTFAEYFDEYYKLDYEDIIGDQPCRFKYREVVPNDFGLSTNEILSCPDKELNAWVSLKKMVQYRTEDEERRDVRLFAKKGKNAKKKLNVLHSLHKREEVGEQSNGGMSQPQVEKKKKKKKKKKKADSEKTVSSQKEIGINSRFNCNSDNTTSVSGDEHITDAKEKRDRSERNETLLVQQGELSTGTVQSSRIKKRKRKQQKGNSSSKRQHVPLSDDRLKAYGLNPRDVKYTLKERLKSGNAKQ